MSHVSTAFIGASAVILVGCATLPAGSGFLQEAAAVQQESVRLLVGESRDRLRLLVAGLAAPASPDAWAATDATAQQAAASLHAARATLVGSAAHAASEPTLAGSAELVILGGTLSICIESLRKIDRMKDSDWHGAGKVARGELRFACLLPLSAF